MRMWLATCDYSPRKHAAALAPPRPPWNASCRSDFAALRYDPHAMELGDPANRSSRRSARRHRRNACARMRSDLTGVHTGRDWAGRGADGGAEQRRPAACSAATSPTSSTRGYERRTIARKAAALRRYFALRDTGAGSCDDDPSRRPVRAATGPAKLPRGARRPDELGRAASNLPRHPPEHANVPSDAQRRRSRLAAARDDAILELLYGSGLRVSECCGLDLGDIDLRRDQRGPSRCGKGSKNSAVSRMSDGVGRRGL